MATQWRLLRPGVVNRSRTYEKVRFTVTAPTTSFDCSRYVGTTAFTFMSSWVIRDRKCMVRLQVSPEGTHLKLVSYLSQSVWKTGTGVTARVQTDGFRVYIFRLLTQSMLPRCPNLKEGGYDAARVSAKTETEGHLSRQFGKLHSGWLILSDQLR